VADPYSFESTIRIHDRAFYDWLGSFRVDYGTINGQDRNAFPVLRVFASPHRAFADTVDFLVKEGWINSGQSDADRAKATSDWPVLPLPIVTIDRDDPIISNELANIPAVFRNYFTDPATGRFVQHPYPLHYITTYRATFWCIKRYTQAFFFEWMMSNLGHLGANQREAYLPVQHAEPWGTINQSLEYLGSGDLSDLEGPGSRHIRSQLSFRLRSWFFKNPLNPSGDGGEPVYAIQNQIGNVGVDSTGQAVELDVYDSTVSDVAETANLAWDYPNDEDRVEGAATATGTSEAGLDITVDSVADKALITAPLTIETPSYPAIVSFHNVVSGTGEFDLVVEQTDLGTAPVFTPVFRRRVAPSELQVQGTHDFTIVGQKAYAVKIQGVGSPADVRIGNVQVRQVFRQPRIPYSNVLDLGTEIAHDWHNLERRPYLVVGLVSNGAGVVQSFNDPTATTAQRTQDVDAATNLGFAMLTMPDASRVRLVVPKTLTLSTFWLQVFDGRIFDDVAMLP
jgi:hypothetical protein